MAHVMTVMASTTWAMVIGAVFSTNYGGAHHDGRHHNVMGSTWLLVLCSAIMVAPIMIARAMAHVMGFTRAMCDACYIIYIYIYIYIMYHIYYII